MIKQAEYIKSIVDLKDEPEQLPQILLLGRSNVGKSTFINTLTNRKNLARTSNTPGKTIALNFYLIDESFYFVDAPGYGYAKRSKSQKDEFVIMLENFLLYSKNLVAVCLLIDFKVGPTVDDIETYEFLKNLGKDIIIVATKKDKIQKTKQQKQEQDIKKRLGNPGTFYAYSSVTKQDIDQIEAEFRSRI